MRLLSTQADAFNKTLKCFGGGIRHILIYGESGTGKSFLASIIANEYTQNNDWKVLHIIGKNPDVEAYCTLSSGIGTRKPNTVAFGMSINLPIIGFSIENCKDDEKYAFSPKDCLFINEICKAKQKTS